MRPFCGFRLRNLLRQAMQAKMQAPLQKISTLFIQNLAKVSLGQVKKMRDDFQMQLKLSIEERVLNDLADCMLGKDFKDEAVRKKKINDLREGRYKDLVMTIFPSQFDIGQKSGKEDKITSTLQQIQYSLFQLYSDEQRMRDKEIDLQKQAIRRVEENGIIFLDQIDKLASTDTFELQRQVSRQGVQRDLLPLIEGTIVNTKLGDVNTQNILFIACGAFSMAKVDDLIPELLGRLPIRVSLSPITQQEFIKILSEPKYNLLMQQIKLLEQQGIKLEYTAQSVSEMAKFAYEMNLNEENIGARRLHGITQKIVQDVSFDAPSYKGKVFKVDAEYVNIKLKDWYKKIDLRKSLI